MRLRCVKRNDGSVRLEFVSLVQIHVLVGVPIVLVENKSVRLDGNPSPGNIDFQLGIIPLVQEEFAIGELSLPTRLAQHVPQGREELISPKLDLVPIFRAAELVADDVAVGPPFGFVRLHFLVAVEPVFLGVVGVEGAVPLQGEFVAPGVAVVGVDEGCEDAESGVAYHDEDAAFHVVEEVAEGVVGGGGGGAAVDGEVEAVVDFGDDLPGLFGFVDVFPSVVVIDIVVIVVLVVMMIVIVLVVILVIGTLGKVLPRNLPRKTPLPPRLLDPRQQYPLDLPPRREHGENVHQVRLFRIGPAVVGVVVLHEGEAFFLGGEAGDAVGEGGGGVEPVGGVAFGAEEAADFGGEVVRFGLGWGRGRGGGHGWLFGGWMDGGG